MSTETLSGDSFLINLPIKPINTKAREQAPIVSPDGKYLFFTSDRFPQKSRDVFWVDAKIIDKLKPKGIDF